MVSLRNCHTTILRPLFHYVTPACMEHFPYLFPTWTSLSDAAEIIRVRLLGKYSLDKLIEQIRSYLNVNDRPLFFFPNKTVTLRPNYLR